MHHLARSLVPGSISSLLPRLPKRVVVVGGGPSGLFCADRLRHHFEVTVIDAKEYFEFTPGILRALVKPTHLSNITFDYREMLENRLGVEFVLGEVASVDVSSPRRGSVVMKAALPGALPHVVPFDYCVVAVGVQNGVWKPRHPGEPPCPSWAMPPASPSSSWHSPTVGVSEVNEQKLDARRKSLRAIRDRIVSARSAVVVGAGLVGVELAGELAHFYPRLKVRLVDGMPTVLPQLPEGAREHAQAWLKERGVRLQLSAPFDPEALGEDEVVIWCVGTRPKTADLFQDKSVLSPKGQIRVNRYMQVLRQTPASAQLSSLSSVSEPIVESDALGQGRVFAVGDAAAVDDMPVAQVIFHGEEMAAVAVANIEAAENIGLPSLFAARGPGGQARRELEEQPFYCCASLGPQDGAFSTQSEVLATGLLAALQKQLIEDTKMGAYRGELLSTLAWMPLH